MTTVERRYRKRFTAAPLRVLFCRCRWWGRERRYHDAFALDFAAGGMAIRSTIKMKEGTQLLLTLENSNHRLLDVPATVARVEQQEQEYLYGIKFTMGKLPDSSSRSAYSILQHLERSLKPNVIST